MFTRSPEGDEYETWKVERVLFGLGFKEEDMERSPNEFSGGYQIRMNLAKLLVSSPDMLVLDEQITIWTSLRYGG